jgi:hypothetical protein
MSSSADPEHGLQAKFPWLVLSKDGFLHIDLLAVEAETGVLFTDQLYCLLKADVMPLHSDERGSYAGPGNKAIRHRRHSCIRGDIFAFASVVSSQKRRGEQGELLVGPSHRAGRPWRCLENPSVLRLVYSATPCKRDDRDFVVFCFSKPEDAEAFAEPFGGKWLPESHRQATTESARPFLRRGA